MVLDTGSGSVADLCAALTPMMPPLFDDRSDIAAELLRAHHQVVSLLAGPICEELFTGERLPGEHDDIEAAEIGRLICRSASSLPAYLAYASAEARGLLLDHADAVHRVANALLKRRTLLGAEIDHLIQGA